MKKIFSFLFFHAALVLIPLFFVAKEKNTKLSFKTAKTLFGELGFRKIELGQFIEKTIVILFSLFGLLIVLGIVFTITGFNDLEKVEQAFSGVTALQIAYLFFVGGIVEEIFFRGYLVPRAGIYWSSLVFAFFHIGYFSIAEFASAFVLGLVLAYFFQKNQNIFPNIIAHQGFNFLIFLAQGV